MITETKTFFDAEVMDGYIRGYLKEYAPAGYDTKVNIELRQSYEEWQTGIVRYEVTINRLESCD